MKSRTLDQYRESFNANLINLLYSISAVARMIYSEVFEEKQELSIDYCRDLHKSIEFIVRHQYKTIEISSSLLHQRTNYSAESILYATE